MNSKELLIKLNKYADNIRNRLSAGLPEKHKGHPETYKRFLQNELSAVTAKIEEMKLLEPAKK